jgi:hypothetical protein
LAGDHTTKAQLHGVSYSNRLGYRYYDTIDLVVSYVCYIDDGVGAQMPGIITQFVSGVLVRVTVVVAV